MQIFNTINKLHKTDIIIDTPVIGYQNCAKDGTFNPVCECACNSPNLYNTNECSGVCACSGETIKFNNKHNNECVCIVDR